MTHHSFRRRMAACAAMLCAVLVAARPAPAQEVVFGPIPNVVTPNGFLVNADYPNLFDEPSRWPSALAKTGAFLMRVPYLQKASDADLSRQFAFLAAHNIPVALVMGVVPSSNGCGAGIEGMVYGPNVNVGVARRIAALGAKVRHLIADEPLTFGHYSMLPTACRYPIETLAGYVGAEVARVRTVFPDADLIDNEAATRLQVFADVTAWIAALRQAAAPTRVVMGLDVQWQVPWTSWAQQFVPLLQQLRMPYGLLVHGTGQNQSDTSWLAAAESYAQAWEGLIAARPRLIMIQSWNAYPTHVLPETDPTAMTSLTNTYCAGTHFRLACNGRH